MDSTGKSIFASEDPLEVGTLGDFGASLNVYSDRVLEVEGGLIINGSLGGDGTVKSDEIYVGATGFLEPGRSPGTLNIQGNLTFEPGAAYVWETYGTDSDLIAVDGNVTLGGNFTPVFLDDYIPAPGESFTVITATSITGDFAGIDFSRSNCEVNFAFENTGTSVIATVEAVVNPGFTAWQQTQFTAEELADPAISGMNADPDLDGMANLLEYHFGLQAKTGDISPLLFSEFQQTNGNSPVTATIAFPWYGIDENDAYVIEWSDDLRAWNQSTIQILAETDGGTHREVLLQATGLVSATGKHFFRFRGRSR